jgi:hypothetical protein
MKEKSNGPVGPGRQLYNIEIYALASDLKLSSEGFLHGVDILQALRVRDVNETQLVLQDRIFVLESLLENLVEDEAEA